MNVHVSYKAGKTPEVEHEFQHQIEKLTRRLRVFKPGLVHLHAFVEQENSHASSSLNLRLPTGQMAAQRSGGNALAAVKAAFADLLSQVTKHKELLRGHWNARRNRRAGKHTASVRSEPVRPATRAQAAHAATVPAVATNTVSTWVNGNLYRLQEFVENELQVRVAAGQLREGQISCEEVIDEVMVSALSEDRKADMFALENWFRRLAVQAIRQLMKSNGDTGTLSLDEPAGTPNVTGSDEDVLQYHQPDDSLPEESVIRDANVRTPEEIFASSEMVAQLDLVLHEVSTSDREAFVLYTLEGFMVEEISRLTDRPPDLVRKSIQQVRERVQRELPEQNRFRRSLLNRSRVA